LASASEDTTIKLWDFDSAHYERTLKGHTGAVTYVSFSPSGDLLVSASADMSAKLWDMSSFACTKTLRGHDHSVSAAIFVGNDHVLTCSRDHTVRCWEVASGYCIRTYTGHSEWVRCLSVSRDGDIFASGSGDNTVIVWKFSTGQILQTLRGHEHVVESVSFQLKARSDSVTAPDPEGPVRIITTRYYQHMTEFYHIINTWPNSHFLSSSCIRFDVMYTVY
jgi:platelet-activating factor acetylhydrolase IB subunit alpha